MKKLKRIWDNPMFLTAILCLISIPYLYQNLPLFSFYVMLGCIAGVLTVVSIYKTQVA